MKIESNTLNMILELLANGINDRKISARLGISRFAIYQIVKILREGGTKEQLTTKTCISCECTQDMLNFTKRITSHGLHFCDFCKVCENKIIENSALGKKFEIFEIPSDMIEQFAIEVVFLRNKGVTARNIAAILCVSCQKVYDVFKKFSIPELSKARLAQFQAEKICSKYNCSKNGEVQLITEFAKRFDKNTGRISYNSQCRTCTVIETRRNNKDSYAKDPAKWAAYKVKGRGRANEREKERKAIDISFKIGKCVSHLIRETLKANNSSKFDESFKGYIPYTLEELKYHLESLFEPWMNWSNHGSYYRNKWNDNDQSTWKWQIDHIIPRSDLPFKSMSEDNFKICWDLSNIRPLSA